MESKMKVNTEKETAVKNETETYESAPRNYYPDIAYNKSKKGKFIALSVLLVVCMGLFIGAMAVKSQWWGISLAAVLLLFVGMLLPSVIKGYPTKPDNPELVVYGHDVTARDKQLRTNDIDKIVVTVELAPVSKNKAENLEFVKEFASKFPEEPCFGSMDIYLKAGPKVKKGETIYLTMNDVLTATADIVNAGVKHYAIFFSMKKIYEPAAFTLTKKEKKTAKLTDVSDKERRRQII